VTQTAAVTTLLCIATFFQETRISPRIERPGNFDNHVIQIERNAHDLSGIIRLNGN
jgi:hypothetical protein